MATPDDIQRRRERMAEAEGLGGWYPAALCDGEDHNGQPTSWYEYEHLDGRRATVSEGGNSTDPELQRLLTERRFTVQPWQLAPLRIASAALRWLAARRASGK